MALSRRFGDVTPPMVLRQQFQEHRRRPLEPLGVFMADLRYLAHRSYPTFSEGVRDALVLDAFVRGLTPDRLRQQVRIAQPSDLDDALNQAQVIEGILSEQPGGIPGPNQPGRPRVFAAYAGERTQSQAMTEGTSQRNLVVCWHCGKTGHMRRECNATESPQLSGNGQGSA